MPFFHFIDVGIHVDGAPLAEYPDPDGGREFGRRITRYIEVKAGQKFEVIVKLLPGFNFQSASHVRAILRIDQEPRQTTKTIRGYPNCPAGQDILRTPRQCKIESRLMRDEATGNWFTYALEFGDLNIKEDPSLLKGSFPSDIDSLGSLRVTVFRANRFKREDPYIYRAGLTKPLDEIPETALKGRDIKNNVKYVVKAQVPPPPLGFSKYVPLEGEHGGLYEFVFLYRNRQILQSLGCIPRTPSPPPDPVVMLERTEEVLRATKESARARILELEARLAKAEAGQNDNKDSGTSGNPAKRTQEQAKLEDDDELLVLPQPPAKRKVVIDLTDE
ncbi:uncharacterized protein PV07_06826 [Cladophialophora immunda]|uniref:DUF7918 domain-containing protein n=1 Tax=Cladophialophora immunda TaxID=569365 RepID=A0A0D1ZGN5_9EURO|nr:uncharacterized protein PV07_06826 [Cladophialophora immunda]KIW27046.1 hypothetical protein PV07_06826 [Cladophialophora immunda]